MGAASWMACCPRPARCRPLPMRSRARSRFWRTRHPQWARHCARHRLGGDATLLGRAFIYALATSGQAGVKHLLELMEKEMRWR
ncbi:alpha-hydroxy-acid oxidizing protein [Comamonas sp. JC664]|uniref:alpha-hydroxy-acid oxidizing protein n=1 Tax=Comamonas sp. JC664 TaxID=2801917 RepID=UPI003609E75A